MTSVIPTLAGNASVNGGTYTVSGAGVDIWSDVDQFHYANVALPGDGSIVARVLSQDDTSPWAKSGVMIKTSAVAGSDYVAMMLTPANGLRLQSHFCRMWTVARPAAPVWLRLTRVGDTISAHRSANGTDWVPVGTQTLSGAATMGLVRYVT